MSTEQSLIPIAGTEVVSNGSLLKSIQETVPRLLKARVATLEATKVITAVVDENAAEVRDLVISVRETADSMTKKRKEITKQLDELSSFLMEPEKDVINENTRLRNLLGSYEQDKLKRNAEIAAKAEKDRKKTQAITDIKAAIKLNVMEVIIKRCKVIDTEAGKYFGEVKDMGDFDQKATSYGLVKWRLSQDLYNACFTVPYNPADINPADFVALVNELKIAMTYEAINAEFLQQANPILNRWKLRLPELREEWKQKFQASEETRARLDKESKERQEKERLATEQALNQTQSTMQAAISSEQQINSIGADFQEQAVLQGMEKTGPVKYVLKITDKETPIKPFVEMIYHVFSSKKFGGIYKLDKDKKPMVDDQGRPVYIDIVQGWIDQFLKCCDVEVKGTQVFEDAKVIVRK